MGAFDRTIARVSGRGAPVAGAPASQPAAEPPVQAAQESQDFSLPDFDKAPLDPGMAATEALGSPEPGSAPAPATNSTPVVIDRIAGQTTSQANGGQVAPYARVLGEWRRRSSWCLHEISEVESLIKEI